MGPSLSLRERCVKALQSHLSQREREGPALREQRGKARG